jgi:hypothetical protein
MAEGSSCKGRRGALKRVVQEQDTGQLQRLRQQSHYRLSQRKDLDIVGARERQS